jgi:ribosomal protein S17E
MNRAEYSVDAKIIKQLSHFLMLHDVSDFTISFSSNQRDVTFTIKSKNITAKISDYMKEKISRERKIEVEVYGWELLDGTDSQNKLDILGSLIDDIEIIKNRDETTIILKRYYAYDQ